MAEQEIERPVIYQYAETLPPKMRPFPRALRYSVYFPNTDLLVNDMGSRGTGKPTESKFLSESKEPDWKALALRLARHIRNSDRLEMHRWAVVGANLLVDVQKADPIAYRDAVANVNESETIVNDPPHYRDRNPHSWEGM
jgi:hypothetical protein